MITYMHEQFIAQAIEGVLMQETDFEYELIIADDASPDRTEEVVQKYICSHPNGNCIKYTKQKNNSGMMPNFVWALQECKGKYIALCEGDDYWTDPLKLQKQVGFLEANPDYVLSFHNVNCLSEDETLKRSKLMDQRHSNSLTLSDFASGSVSIHTLSVLFKNLLSKELFDFINKFPMGDYPLLMNLASRGKMNYIPDEMAVYRVHEGGLWSKQHPTSRMLNTILALKKMKPYYDPHIQRLFERQMVDLYKQALYKSIGSADLFTRTWQDFSQTFPKDFEAFLTLTLQTEQRFTHLSKGRWMKLYNWLMKVRKKWFK